MKKLLIAFALFALLACAFCAGRREGVRHAIEDSEIFTVTCYNPDAPEDSAWGDYDQCIYIDLDGQVYAHGMYQG